MSDQQTGAIVLYESQLHSAVYATGVLRQPVMCNVWWGVVKGQLSLQVLMYQDGKLIGSFCEEKQNIAADLVSANRTALLLAQLDVLSELSFKAACFFGMRYGLPEGISQAMAEGLDSRDAEVQLFEDCIRRQVDEDVLDVISNAMLENIESEIERLDKAGIYYCDDSIRLEIERGQITVTPYLHGQGFGRRKDLLARRRRLLNELRGDLSVILEYVMTNDAYCVDNSVFGQILDFCIEGRARGVRHHAHLLALAIVLFEEEQARAALSWDAMQWAGSRPREDRPADAGFSSQASLITFASEWVAETVGNGLDLAEIAEVVTRLHRDWDGMPIVDE